MHQNMTLAVFFCNAALHNQYRHTLHCMALGRNIPAQLWELPVFHGCCTCHKCMRIFWRVCLFICYKAAACFVSTWLSWCEDVISLCIAIIQYYRSLSHARVSTRLKRTPTSLDDWRINRYKSTKPTYSTPTYRTYLCKVGITVTVWQWLLHSITVIE